MFAIICLLVTFIADLLMSRRKGNARAPGGQFVLHARALPGNPYDGHTLGAVIEATERLTGRAIERAYVDKGYRGHHTPNPRRVFMSGQKRAVFGRKTRAQTTLRDR